MILYVLWLCAFAVATAEFILIGLLPDIAGEFAVSVPVAGFLVTAYMLVVTIGGPLAVLYTRRLSRPAVLTAAMALALVSAVGSASAGTYGVLLVARMGSALAQALFVAVASDVAMSAVPVKRQTAAVAMVFNGFALATVLGLPIGTVLGQVSGWRAAFLAVAALCAFGLAGVVLVRHSTGSANPGPAAGSVRDVVRPAILRGLLVTVLAFTGFVAVFTYVAPMLRDLTGLASVRIGVMMAVYGLGTLVGTVLAGRVPPPSIARVLPVPLLTLAIMLGSLGLVMRHPVTAGIGLFLLGANAFVLAPLLQTWLMNEAGRAAAGLAAAANISVFGLGGALGAALGAAVLDLGVGAAALGPVAAVPVALAAAVATTARRPQWTSSRTVR